MGCCATYEEDDEQNKQVNKEIIADKKIDAKVNKLLFLGSGGYFITNTPTRSNSHTLTNKKKQNNHRRIG